MTVKVPMGSAKSMETKKSFLGKGIYSLQEASLLTKVNVTRIRRWLAGYGYAYKGKHRDHPPVWRGQARRQSRPLTLTFLDLLEVRFVDAFRNQGVSLPIIRKVALKAREELGIEYPFVSLRFKTDGRQIFRGVGGTTYEFLSEQSYFEKLIQPFLSGVDFDQDVAIRWWPLAKGRQVVLDPERCFGKPIVFDAGVPTVILAQAYTVEHDENSVARWFKVGRAAVRDAVEFEEGLRAA